MNAQKNNPTPTVLVTGGAGFIGSTYVNLMVPRYPKTRFVIVDALTDVADKRNIRVLDRGNVSFVRTDIRNVRSLARIFKTSRPTEIVHFAAETHVDVSIKKPQLFVETNVLGTEHLLSLARAFGVQRFLHMSTDEVYGELSAHEPAFTESSPLKPNSPYSASKAAAEHLVRAFHRTYGLDTVIVRCSNNYGPYQDRTKFIPLFITRLLAGETAPLYGSGKNVRDWLYVEDHVEAIDLVLHKGKSGEVYNVGGDNEWRNKDVAKLLLKLTGAPASLMRGVPDRPGHDFRYAIDARKIRSELGWKPRTNFGDGLARTVEFYRTRPKRR